MKTLVPHAPTACRRLAVALLALTIQAAIAQTRSFDLSAQPLDQALTQFARQAGLQLAAAPDLLRGLRGQPVSGSQDVKAALAELLRGSGLQGRINEGLLTIERVSPRADAETVLPIVRVKANADHETAVGPVAGYAAKRSATGTKTDTPLLETPQSISVVGREEMEARGAQDVMDVVRYAPGITTNVYGPDNRGWEDIAIRGFNTYYSGYRDGLAQTPAGVTYPLTEPYGLERVEVLRGPASWCSVRVMPGASSTASANCPRAAPSEKLNSSSEATTASSSPLISGIRSGTVT